MDRTESFEAERPRLLGIATRVLGDHAEAEDVVQQAWLRLDRAVTRDGTDIENLPAWLTTVTTRLCLDRLRARTPVPVEDPHLEDAVQEPWSEPVTDPADDVALADTVGIALQAVSTGCRRASGWPSSCTTASASTSRPSARSSTPRPSRPRKLASRARAKVAQPAPEDALADWEVVDAFMAAARGGDFERLLQLLAPDAVVGADEAAVLAGTPASIEGRDEVATFFNGSAQAAMAVFVGDRPASAWFHRGAAAVVFDFEVADGQVRAITFRAEPAVLEQVVRREGPLAK